MRLWTWQKKGFSITDPNVRVDSRTYSPYYNDPAFPEAKKAYEELWKQLRTCQFHWCFTDGKEAKSGGNKEECRGSVLWEFKVQEGEIFRIVCSAAWNWILRRKAIPQKFLDLWREEAHEQASRFQQIKDKLEQDFRNYWTSKTEETLWESLFLDKFIFKDTFLYDTIKDCVQILVRHPVKARGMRILDWSNVYQNDSSK